MRAIFLALAGLALALQNPACAQAITIFQTGNDLLRKCQSQAATDVTMCFGYLEGINDAFTGPSFDLCIPLGVEAGQLKDVVVQYLITNAAIREQTAALLTYQAYRETWACPKKAKK